LSYNSLQVCDYKLNKAIKAKRVSKLCLMSPTTTVATVGYYFMPYNEA